MTPPDIIYDPIAQCDRRLGLQVKPLKLRFGTFAATGLDIMTPEEIRKAAIAKQRSRSIFTVDWIKDQKSHGSCNGFAAAEALERARHKRGLPRVVLSGASVYSLINGGRDDGSGLEEGMEALMNVGVLTEAECGWNDIYKDSRGQSPTRARFKALECYQVETEAELATGLVNEFTAVVAVNVTNAFYRLNSYGVAGGSGGVGNHSVCVDDVLYDEALGGFKFDMPNSWNITFGEQGRAYLTWRDNLSSCTRYHRFYLIRGAVDDSQGENPPAAV